MTVQIEYGATFLDNDWNSLADFFGYADVFFNDTDYNENVGEFAGPENPDPLVDLGWFWSLFGTFSGTQYVLEGGTGTESFGMIIESADGEYLDYSFMQGPETHTLYGEIGSITFGRGLVEAADGSFSFSEELISFEGLDTLGLNAGVDANGNLIGRNSTTEVNDTHAIVNGLMNSDFTALMDVLNAIDPSTDILDPATGLPFVIGQSASNAADVLLAA